MLSKETTKGLKQKSERPLLHVEQKEEECYESYEMQTVQKQQWRRTVVDCALIIYFNCTQVMTTKWPVLAIHSERTSSKYTELRHLYD